MSLVVVAILTAKPGKGPQVIESFRQVSPLVHAEPGLLREHLLSELATALGDTRRSLPGPLPAGQSEDDPDTGLVEPSREL